MKNLEKLLIIGSLTLMMVCPLFAQSQVAAWDSTYRPATYPLLTRQFNSFPHSKKDIVFLGNSITFGVDWYELLREPHARNRGISGDITFGVLQRLQEIIDGKPAKLFILIGINDILRNVPDHYIIANHKKLIERVQAASPSTKIYLQSILPVNDSFTQVKSIMGKNPKVLEINQALQRIAREYKVTYVDLHTAFCDKDGKLTAELTYDGLHLTLEGYKLWGEVLYSHGTLKRRVKSE